MNAHDVDIFTLKRLLMCVFLTNVQGMIQGAVPLLFSNVQKAIFTCTRYIGELAPFILYLVKIMNLELTRQFPL